MTRMVYYVTPVGDVWGVKRARRKRVESIHMFKAEAVARAKRLAKVAARGQVRVHGRDGCIQSEFTYSDDPRRTRG